MPKQVGIGLVGLDHWYTAFGILEQASTKRGLRLVGVSDQSEARLSEIERDYEAGILSTDYRELMQAPEVDLVCCLSNTRESLRAARAALRAGKHVAIVKPMAMTLRQADSLIELAEKEGLVLWCFDQLGRMRATPRLRNLISGGRIGQPISVHQTMWAGLPKPWRGRTGPSWWTDADLVPCGAWSDHAIYSIDMLRALLDAEVDAVHGEIANKRYPELSVEDYGVGTLRFSNGMVAVLEHAWTAGRYHANWTKIVGTDGVIHMERAAFGDQTVLATNRGVRQVNVSGRRSGMLDPVLAAIRKGQVKPSPARESRTNLAVAFAVYKSAKTGRYVQL